MTTMIRCTQSVVHISDKKRSMNKVMWPIYEIYDISLRGRCWGQRRRVDEEDAKRLIVLDDLVPTQDEVGPSEIPVAALDADKGIKKMERRKRTQQYCDDNLAVSE